jgi:hypothetical protein
MSGITVSRRGDELIAVKRSDPAAPERRRAEAELLRRIDHPGVVRLVAFVEGEPAELQTGYVGTDTWARTPPTSPDRVVVGLGRLCATVADLHEQGICHGMLGGDHIVFDNEQRPVLCGFADAQPFGPRAELDDMVALAGLIRDAARGLPDQWRRPLDDLAGRATSGDFAARTLATELAAIPEPQEPARRRVSSRTKGGGMAGGALLAGLVVGFALRSGDETERPASLASTMPSVTVASNLVITTTTITTTTTVLAESTAPTAIEFTHEGRRYGLGAPGDIAVLGDWDCDGVRTPALLQRRDGTVAVFDGWPDANASRPAAATASVPGATGLEAVDQDGCDQLRILEPTGSSLFTPEP